MKPIPSKRSVPTIVAPSSPEPGEPDWERLAGEINSLASDLDALGFAVRELSLPAAHHADANTPPRTASEYPVPWVDPWFASSPDRTARLASVDLRLAQVKRSLGIVGRVARMAREARPPSEEVSPPGAAPRALLPTDEVGPPPALTLPLEPTPPSVDGGVAPPPKAASRPKRRARSRSARSVAAAGPSGSAPNPLRAIPGTGRPSIAAFLKTNRTEGFDIQLLNALPLPTLLEEAHGDRALLTAACQQAEDLMVRVKHEVDDPESAGAFLRDQVRHWHQHSGQDRQWTTRMPERWAGLFADSRVHGGRLRPWLNHRLWTLRESAIRAGPFGRKLRLRLSRDGTIEAAVARAAPQQIRAEVAQAILDDLGTHARDPETPLPLICLSELAVRRQVITVNEALGQLFSVPDAGPFVVLHPNRYPDCEEVVIRLPVPKAKGAALAYTLGPNRAAGKPLARERRGERPPERPTAPGSPVGTEDAPDAGVDSETIWAVRSVGAPAWREVVDDVRDARSRLVAPPAEFRSAPAYRALCELLLDDREFRKAFLAVRWRARPAGVPLLASLVEEGTLTSEVSTDHEYLEAELGELVRAGLATKTSDGLWTLREWTIAREGSHREGFRFRAQRNA